MKNPNPTSKKKRRLWVALLSVCLLLAVAIGLGSNFLLHFALFPDKMHGHGPAGMFEDRVAESPQLRPWADSLVQNHALRDTFVVMPSGERHHATYLPAQQPSDRVAILVHGYDECGLAMIHIASIYHHLGYNILMPDLHSYAPSEGEAVQMGWLDRLDVMHWMEVANRRFGRGKDTRMVLHGISMGAATVMNVSGERLPNYVKCFVEDCGYTSVWDEFGSQLREQFSLPQFPLLYTTSLLCRAKYGWSFGEAAPLRQVARCRKPMLFIHGDQDRFVPFHMFTTLYAAKPQPKAYWVSQGSGHADSFQDHPAEYTAQVTAFVSRYIRP